MTAPSSASGLGEQPQPAPAARNWNSSSGYQSDCVMAKRGYSIDRDGTQRQWERYPGKYSQRISTQCHFISDYERIESRIRFTRATGRRIANEKYLCVKLELSRERSKEISRFFSSLPPLGTDSEAAFCCGDAFVGGGETLGSFPPTSGVRFPPKIASGTTTVPNSRFRNN